MKVRWSLLLLSLATHCHAADWPEWRGPHSNSVAPEDAYPLEWSEDQNIRWKIPLPDRGNSSPIVSQGKVIITQAIDETKRRSIMAFDRRRGTLLWQHAIEFDQDESTHAQNPYCAASPVSDGMHVIATFGSAGVVACDMQGNLLWHRDLGPQQHVWGNASSPVIQGDDVYIYHGPGPDAALYALDLKTGKTSWVFHEPVADQKGRTDGFRGNEKGITGSFSTPLPLKVGDRQEVVMSFPNRLIAFDLIHGKQLWWADGLNPLVYTSPIQEGDLIVAMGGYKGSSIAVKTGGLGDISQSHQVWQSIGDGNNVGSGVMAEDHLYMINTSGIAICRERNTGKVMWEERVRGKGPKSSSWSSMIRCGDRLFCMNQSSEMVILQASPQFQLIRINSLDNAMCNATHAMSDGEIFVRTWKHLWCISQKKDVAYHKTSR